MEPSGSASTNSVCGLKRRKNALNPAIVPRVRLNQVYAELFKRHRTADNAELADHLQEARWTVRNV